MTLDEAIRELNDLRTKHGGGIPFEVYTDDSVRPGTVYKEGQLTIEHNTDEYPCVMVVIGND